MKKTLALLLSVLMVISTITCIFTVTTANAQAIAGELIANGDFENTTLNPVGTNMGGISGSANASVVNNGKWLRATGGHSYATYGDLTAYDAETDTVTKATETEYAEYFTACSTVIAQPDNQSNHIGRMNQTLFQGFNFNDDEGTFTFKAKVKANAATTKFSVTFSGMQTKTTDGVKPTDSFYSKYSLEVLDYKGNFTYTYYENGVDITLANATEWTDIELVVKATRREDAQPTKPELSILETDFTLLRFYHNSGTLNTTSGTNGNYYRKNGMYIDDVSLKHYVDPVGEAEFYKDGKKIENTNEYGGAKYTVNGKEVLAPGLGDVATITADYNKDANVFAGWYKDDVLVTRDETFTITANGTDVYVPKLINKNLLEGTAASFESFTRTQSLRGTTTNYPEVGEWGTVANAGYLGGTVAETVYDVDGNAYTQVDSDTRKVTSNAAAIVADAYKGNNALKLSCEYHTFVTTLKVTPNTNYTLTYYVKGVDTKADTPPVNMKTGILTTVNTAITKTLVPQGETSHSGVSSRYAVADYNPAFALVKNTNKELVPDTWEKMTLTFNSKSFETLYLGITPFDTEVFWVDELCLTAEEKPGATPAVKYVDVDGEPIDAEKTTNIYAKTTVTEDFDGSYLLDLEYEDESGAYTFLGWYDAENNLLSKEVNYDYDGEIANVYAKIINRNELESAASYEGYEVGTDLMATDMNRNPNEGEWGVNTTKGYFQATVEEVIYDKYGYAYQQIANGERSKYGASVKITSDKARTGKNSLVASGSWATTLTAFDVEPNTNYTVTFYALTSNATLPMEYSGITTTVNVADNCKPEALDGGTADMKVALGNMGVGYALSRIQNIVLSDTEWTKVTHTFNSGNLTKVYFCVCPTEGEKYYIDDLSLVAEEKPETVDVKIVNADGTDVADDVAANASVKTTVEKDIYTGNKTLNVDYEAGAYTFLGWYNADDALVSANKEFVVTGSLVGVYAKLQNNNLLTYAASYEGYDVNTNLKYTGTDYPSGVYFGGNKNAGYLGVTFEETIYDNAGNAIEQTAGGSAEANYIKAIVSTDKARTGNKSINLKNGFWTASMGIDVKPNTDYALSYWMLAPKRENKVTNTIALSAISTTVNTGEKGTGSVAPLNQATNLYLDSKDLTILHDGENWIRVTHSFNSMNLSKVYLVIGQTSDADAAASWAYLDDMVMIETVPTTMDVEMKNCASIAPVNASLDELYVGQEFTFKVIDSMETAANVTFNGNIVTANTDGTYTIVLAEENALSVRFDGDETLPNYDEDELGRKLNVNNHEVYSEPVWEGDTVYHETALFTPDKDTVKLLYPVEKIVSLRSYDLTQNYIEGYDFEITEDGMIKRLEGGRIPVWPTSLVTDKAGDWPTTDGRYVVLTGDTTYPKYAISVTYKHSTTFADGYQPATPESQQADLNNTLKKLEKGEEVNIVVYGDSISCGWSSSSMNPSIKIYDETNTEGNYITRYNINVAPYAPTWVQMLETELISRYPDAKINIKNLSLGGKSSPWGATNIAARLALWVDENGNQVTPDLIMVGFGVNDSAGGVTVQNFKTNMKAIVDNARTATGNMNMEALYYSPMFPNQNATKWPEATLLAYENVLEEIANADDNIGLLKLSSIFSQIIKCKDSEDYLNTNLNHGNDFTARLYYTGIMAAMTKTEDDLATPDTPAAPKAEEVTSSSVTLTATQGYEYSMNGVDWQESNVFGGLSEQTEYKFYQRVAKTETAYASEISVALTVTTPAIFVGFTGDANGDEVINLKDLVLLAQYAAGWDVKINTAVMDLNKDGEVDLKDVNYLSRHLAGWSECPID